MILGFVLRQSKKLEKPIWEDSFTNYSQLRSRAERQYTREPKSSKQWLGHRLALCVAGRRAQTTPGAVAALLGRFHAGTHAAYTNERLLALPRRTFADDAEPRVGLGVASAGLFMHWAQFESSWRASHGRAGSEALATGRARCPSPCISLASVRTRYARWCSMCWCRPCRRHRQRTACSWSRPTIGQLHSCGSSLPSRSASTV